MIDNHLKMSSDANNLNHCEVFEHFELNVFHTNQTSAGDAIICKWSFKQRAKKAVNQATLTEWLCTMH